MTIPELIDLVLDAVHTKFYTDRPREFLRDRTALMKSVARWGYACHQRGWDFKPQFILKEIMTVLLDIQAKGREFKYLPVYLQGAIDRSVGQRAEELQAASRVLAPKVAKLIRNTERVEAVVEKGNTETLAAVYRDLAGRQRRKRTAKKQGRGQRQGELL